MNRAGSGAGGMGGVRRLSLVAACALAAGLLGAARPAVAQSEGGSTYRAVIDRADLEPSTVGGYRLRVYVSALSLDGKLLELSEPKAIKMLAGRSEIRAPVAIGHFAAAQTDLAMVFVIQATSDYADVIRVITEAADAGLLEALPEARTQVGIVTYGETVGPAKLGGLKTGRGKLRGVQSEGAATEPVLLDAMDRALRLLKGARTDPPGRPLRKMIVVISDGRDRSNDRERVTALGKRAAAAGVRIHSFAHAPSDVRRPLLLLGELSKRSFGTFRWLRKDARTVQSWQTRFEQLRDEIKGQHVLTYFVDDDISGRELELTITGRTELTSLNKLKIPAPGCHGEPCDVGYCADACMVVRAAEQRGAFGWILLVGGIGLGALLLLGGIGFVFARLQQTRVHPPPGMPGVPGAVPGAPGSIPPGMPGAAPPGRVPSRAPSGAPSAQVPAQYPSGPPQMPMTGPVTAAKLYVMTGARAGETLNLYNGFRLGAAPDNHFVIVDGFTSTHHAQIGVDAQGNCWITDLGSTNGTFVNGVRVTQKVLDHGVSVRIGSTEIRFLAQ